MTTPPGRQGPAIVFLSLLVFLALGMGSRAEASAIRGVLTRYEGGGLIARWIHSHPWAERFRRVGGLRSRILLAAVAVALLPVFGNLLVGPWVAPAELLLLLLAAATVWRKPGTGTSSASAP